ncbi:hypothetical protein HYQ46_004065 [Verticillium longisporum]|nr:hypothetical protein HYQ46_004065 [Verticillium longisporum]
MWHPPSQPILKIRIETLDQQHVHGPRLVSRSVLVQHLRRNEVLISHRVRFCHSQRVLEHRPDGPPHVDDLIAAPQQLVGLGSGHVFAKDQLCAVRGLVNVDAMQRPFLCGVAFTERVPIGRATAYLVPKNVDAGGPGAGHAPFSAATSVKSFSWLSCLRY